MTFVDFTVTSNEQTVESQVAAARDERDRLGLWGRILPITFTAIGVVALVGGALLGSFSLRAESALIDPGLTRPIDSSGHAAPKAIGCQGPRHRPRSYRLQDRRICLRTDQSDSAGFRAHPGAIAGTPAYALVLALLVTAPLLAPGYLLLRDAVSTPRSYLSDSALGLSEAAPRALPQDFFVALATELVDGGVVVKALLVAGLFLAGWGSARLAATVRMVDMAAKTGASEQNILDWLGGQRDAMLALLQTLVNTDSGSYDKPGVDAVGGHIREFPRRARHRQRGDAG